MRFSRVLSSLLLIAAAASVAAQDEIVDWAPSGSLLEGWDWIQLTSDEWLKGKITAMYEEKLEFKSDKLGEFEFDWGDVRRVISGQVMQAGFLDGDPVTGMLVVDGDVIKLIDGEEEQQFSRAQVLAITAGPPRESSYWSTDLSLGANLRSGNSNQEEWNTWIKTMRRTTRNRLALEYLGNYSTAEEVEIADNHRFTGLWDIFLSDRFFVSPVIFEWYRDPFQNIDQRWTLGAGVGYEIIDTAKAKWTISGGPSYQDVHWVAVEEGTPESFGSFSFFGATLFTYDITSKIDFTYDYRFFLLDDEAGRYSHHMLTGLEIELTNLFDLDLSWVWDRVQKPRADADGVFPEQDDYRFIIGLGLDF